MKYLVTTPPLLRLAFPNGLLWQMPEASEPTVYLTFDDGPHPTATPFVMQQLERYGARGTFFCIGKNVQTYPDIYKQLITQGHRVANHTQTHANGWKTEDVAYVNNIRLAAMHIDSNLFRPPYGRIRQSQVQLIKQHYPHWKICMWDVLSGDFDPATTPEQCLKNVVQHIKPGSIVLFHDSDKAWASMSYALPHVLQHCHTQGWKMEALQ